MIAMTAGPDTAALLRLRRLVDALKRRPTFSLRTRLRLWLRRMA